MKNLVLRNFVILLSFFYVSAVSAQVSGLSYTISPTAEYNWFSDQSGLKDGFLGGAQFGFGFGEFVELRANYQKGFNLQTDLTKFGLEETVGMDTSYMSRDINLSRYGGELKLNLSKGAFLPYMTLGTGIQNLEADSLGNNKQIFLTTGLGIKFSAASRYTIGLQALRTSYKSNSYNTLMDGAERELYGVTSDDLVNNSISNYALRASLVLYLGGRKPGNSTKIDNAYYDNFSGGFRGLSIPIEPSVMKINFHDDLQFRSTWMAGASAGINVGPLIGVRGFYWRALEDGKTTDFDELTMYGGEARFKLNEGKGFTPWITIGGGQINAGDNYVGRDSSVLVDNKAFAMGGLGMDLPFTKYFKATGFVRSVLTSTQATDDVSMPEDLKNSLSYGVSLNFILGKKPQKAQKLQKDAMDAYLLATQQDYNLASEQLKTEYDEKLIVLEQQLENAIQNQDVEAVKAITEQKEITEQVRSTINSPSRNGSQMNGSPFPSNNGGKSVIQMTPAEFQLLLRDILDAGKNGGGQSGVINTQPSNQNNQNSQNSIDDAILNLKVEQQLADLKEAINDLEDDNKSASQVMSDLKSRNSDVSDKLDDLMRSFNDKIYSLERESDKYKNQINDLNRSQGRLEAGLKSKDANVTVESIDSKRINQDIEDTNDRIDDLNKTILESFMALRKDIENGDVANTVAARSDDAGKVSDRISNKDRVQADSELDGKIGNFVKLKYKGMSGFAGFGVGGSATFNVGYRLHYAVGDSSNIEFMPETFFGLGSPSSFGIMANATYALPFLTKSDMIKPYIGLGLGLMKVGDSEDADQLKGAYNFIAGTTLNVWSGDVYVDFTARNLFKYNQLVVGYRFPF